jgi:hypothetical protein
MKIIQQIFALFLILIIIIIIYKNYDKIPSKIEHINRNKYNVFPVGKLQHINNDNFIDENNIIWKRRTFFNSILHNPFKYYVFETYSRDQISSSEVEVLKSDFDNNLQNFKPASYNFYSSFNYPLSHLFADIIPIIIYLRPQYKIYN